MSGVSLHALPIEVNTMNYAVSKTENGIEVIFVLRLADEDFKLVEEIKRLEMFVMINDDKSLGFQLHSEFKIGAVYSIKVPSINKANKKVRAALLSLMTQAYMPVYVIDTSGKEMFRELVFLKEDKKTIKEFLGDLKKRDNESMLEGTFKRLHENLLLPYGTEKNFMFLCKTNNPQFSELEKSETLRLLAEVHNEELWIALMHVDHILGQLTIRKHFSDEIRGHFVTFMLYQVIPVVINNAACSDNTVVIKHIKVSDKVKEAIGRFMGISIIYQN